MNEAILTLIGRIEEELKEMKIVVKKIQDTWDLAANEKGDISIYLESIALNLHSFYTGAEKVFELIAKNIDNHLPSGERWHRELLKQMSISIPEVRPAVISKELEEQLEVYLGFRHVVRNLYTIHLKPERINILVSNLKQTFHELQLQLNYFTSFLRGNGTFE